MATRATPRSPPTSAGLCGQCEAHCWLLLCCTHTVDQASATDWPYSPLWWKEFGHARSCFSSTTETTPHLPPTLPCPECLPQQTYVKANSSPTMLLRGNLLNCSDSFATKFASYGLPR